MRLRSFILLVCSIALLYGCKDEKASLTKELVNDLVKKKSDLLELSSFQKVNGQTFTQNGIELYKLFFEVGISVSSNVDKDIFISSKFSAKHLPFSNSVVSRYWRNKVLQWNCNS
jgi:hypothetical protein